MKRPFSTRFEASYPNDRMELEVKFDFPLGDDGISDLKSTIEKFVDLARGGALSGAKIRPADSELELYRSSWGPQQTTWWFRGVRLDPTSVCILLNCLHTCCQDVKPISAVSLSWGELANLKDPLLIQFPAQYSPIPFALQFGDVNEPFDVGEAEVPFCISVDFQKAQRQADAERFLEEVIGAWISVVNLGGYARGANPARSRIDFTDDMDQVTSKSIELYIESMLCDERAICGLVNLLSKAHDKLAKIARVGFRELS